MSSPILISIIEGFKRDRDTANRNYDACSKFCRTVDFSLTFPWTDPNIEHFPQELRPYVSFFPGHSTFPPSLTIDTHSSPQPAVDAAIAWIQNRGGGGYVTEIQFPGNRLKISLTNGLSESSKNLNRRPVLVVKHRTPSGSDNEPESLV